MGKRGEVWGPHAWGRQGSVSAAAWEMAVGPPAGGKWGLGIGVFFKKKLWWTGSRLVWVTVPSLPRFWVENGPILFRFHEPILPTQTITSPQPIGVVPVTVQNQSVGSQFIQVELAQLTTLSMLHMVHLVNSLSFTLELDMAFIHLSRKTWRWNFRLIDNARGHMICLKESALPIVWIGPSLIEIK